MSADDKARGFDRRSLSNVNQGVFMRKFIHLLSVSVLVVLAACAQKGPSAPDRPAAAAAPSGPGPGMNAAGEVVDASKVEGGSGQQIKGLHDTDGEITGKAFPGAKFTKLQIGMGMKQVTDLIGPPTDQGAYITGKAFIPFYFGGDRHRFEMAYKGQGRLVFAGGGMGDYTGGNLIWIIYSPSESGYR